MRRFIGENVFVCVREIIYASVVDYWYTKVYGEQVAVLQRFKCFKGFPHSNLYYYTFDECKISTNYDIFN